MNDDEKLPRYSVDLIEWLDGNIVTPKLPLSAEGYAAMDANAVRRAAFTSGARALVEQLKDWLVSMEEGNDDDSPDDGPGLLYPELFGPDGEVRQGTSPQRLAEVATEQVPST